VNDGHPAGGNGPAVRRARWRIGAAALAAIVAVLASAAATPPTGDDPHLAAGRRIYREGVLPSGKPVRGVVQGDVAFTGLQASCMTCHRRSGFGASEAGSVAPPVIGDFLYRPVRLGAEQTGLRRSHGPGTRPAYTDETLVRAIREGVDPAGRTLAPLMPRFALSDADALTLVAYLKSLSSAASPGVTESTIHLATVVTPDVAPTRRAAFLGVLEAFVRDRNSASRLEDERKVRSGWEKRREYQAYRRLALHVWELAGPPSSWRAQLEERYRAEPVFALLSGIGDDDWRAVHEFCEANEIPCLFPITDLPVISEGDYYTIYFSRGLTLQAEALAAHLRDAPPPGPVVQVFRAEPHGAVPAAALRAALEGYPQVAVVDRVIGDPAPPDASYWQALIAEVRPAALVLWLGRADLAGFASISENLPGVFLSASLLGDDPGAVASALRRRAQFVWPYAPQSPAGARTARARAWLEARGLKVVDERAQTGAFFAVTLASDALKELRGYYTRDYLVERIEHMVDSSVTTSVYPRLNLAPGVRFASKGCYIVRLTDGDPPAPVAVSDWIVP
jgi:mono/diheme cytochrome c family protein